MILTINRYEVFFSSNASYLILDNVLTSVSGEFLAKLSKGEVDLSQVRWRVTKQGCMYTLTHKEDRSAIKHFFKDEVDREGRITDKLKWVKEYRTRFGDSLPAEDLEFAVSNYSEKIGLTTKGIANENSKDS